MKNPSNDPKSTTFQPPEDWFDDDVKGHKRFTTVDESEDVEGHKRFTTVDESEDVKGHNRFGIADEPRNAEVHHMNPLASNRVASNRVRKDEDAEGHSATSKH